MATILLDTYAVACPQLQWFDSRPSFEAQLMAYLQNLVDWERLRQFRTVQFASDNDLTSALAAENSYPFWDSLAQALRETGLSEDFQLQDINTIVQALLQKSVRIEDEAELDDLIVGGYTLGNDCCAPRLGRFADHLGRLLAVKALMERRRAGSTVTMKLASCSGPAHVGSVEFTGSVSLCAWTDGNVEEDVPPLQTQIECYRSAADLHRNFDPFHWWETGDVEGCHCALSLICAKDELDPGTAVASVRARIKLGRNFILSARNLGFIHDKSRADRLMRACKEVLADEKLASVHQLRVSAGANAPTHQRGKFVAWRKDLGDEFHLHYWSDGATIELADVVVHNNFSITY